MEIKLKKIDKNAVIPTYAKEGDAGLDLVATSVHYDIENNVVSYGIGICIEIPKGYVGLIFPRSSIYRKTLSLSNSVGVIDSGYRGELILKFNCTNTDRLYQIGDRVGQLLIMKYPNIEFKEVNDLSKTQRSEKGFGSTGE
jgi:dUTP pyrophosphatase